jgi:hypothetical protein
VSTSQSITELVYGDTDTPHWQDIAQNSTMLDLIFASHKAYRECRMRNYRAIRDELERRKAQAAGKINLID